jgi:two-component system, chemotaxis family, chemotaxis protein CheY
MNNAEGQSPTILIVEDIDWIRSGMKKAIERQGYRTVEATNGVEAAEIAEREPIGLILTEEELPTFDALMARSREHSTLSNIPVVIVNPDAEIGARDGDAYLLTDYAEIPFLLTILHRDVRPNDSNRS